MRFQKPQLQLNWRFAIGQVFLTALGVALALAGNAMWTSHVEHVREQSDLHVALDAARTNERRLRQAVYEDSVSISLLTRLTQWFDGTASIPPDSVGDIVSNSSWWADSRPITGPFEMIVHSGDIDLIQDPTLRAMIPTYLGELQNRMDDLRAVDQAILNRAPKIFILPSYRALRRKSAAASGAARSLRNESVANSDIAGQRNLVFGALGYYRIMLRQTTELRLALEKHLGAKPVVYPQPRLLRDSF